MSKIQGDRPNAKTRENANFSSSKDSGGVSPPRIGGKFVKGDSRSRTHTGGLTQGKNRGGQY